MKHQWNRRKDKVSKEQDIAILPSVNYKEEKKLTVVN